jgi:predicted phosphodiesterase
MTKIAIISDTHGLHDHVRVPPCDILIHAGDLTRDIGRKSLQEFLVWLERQPAPHKILIAGNHDGAFQKWPDLAVQMVKEYAPSVTYLQDSGCEIGGLKFWGSPYTPTFFDWYFMRDRGADIKRHWDMIPEGLDVLITHGPPEGIFDVSSYDNKGYGCKDLLEAVKRVKPRVHCFGHFHATNGQTKVGDTLFINATICNEAYKPVNQPVVIDLP